MCRPPHWPGPLHHLHHISPGGGGGEEEEKEEEEEEEEENSDVTHCTITIATGAWVHIQGNQITWPHPPLQVVTDSIRLICTCSFSQSSHMK